MSLTLFRPPESAAADAIQEVLDQMVLAHETIVVADAEIPKLLDDGKIIAGLQPVLDHLERLQAFKKEWEKFQTDACYCDDSGEII